MKRRTTFRAAGVLASLAVLAACGSTAASPGPAESGTAQAPAATAPAASAWTPGGTYTGPVPPASGILGPTNAWHLSPYTSPDGYKVQDDIVFGVPLHYAVPAALEDCNLSAPAIQDLPPGQYVVPFEIVIHNHTPQQARAIAPIVTAGSLDMTGSGDNGIDTGMTWASGNCQTQDYDTLNQRGSDALYGLVGPATIAQLASSYVTVNWSAENNVPGTPPQLTLPLAQLLPHAGASWLTANGGTAPPAQAAPSSVPASCPSPPAGLTSDEQTNFNSVCGIWISQVAGLTGQFSDNGTLSPGKTAEAYCSYYDNLSPAPADPATTAAGMDKACREGIAAAGGPAANAS